MARPLRLEYAGAIYHVTARGNERRTIFRTDGDRRRFLEKLEHLAGVHHVEVYAFVLMGNHYHLVLFTPRGNLSRFLQQFNTSYTAYFNRRHSRTGHLFAGRYKAKLVEGGDYLLRLTRYIHLNPVKVQDCRELTAAECLTYLDGYRWSSYRSHVGLAPPLAWIVYEALRAFPGMTAGAAGTAYRAYVEETLKDEDEAICQARERSTRAFGGEAFCCQVEAQHREAVRQAARPIDIAVRRVECGVPVERVTAAVLKAYGLKESELFRRGNREAKDMWLSLAQSECGLDQRAMGPRFGHADGSTVSRRLAWFSAQLAGDPRLARRHRDLVRSITNRKA
jgi:REP element-mobilizing transposase RayT